MMHEYNKTYGITIFEMLIVIVIVSMLASFGANTFVEVYRNYQAQRDYALGQTQINISADRLFDTHLTPLFQSLAKPLAIDTNNQWIIFAIYETGFDQHYIANSTYLSQVVRLELVTNSGVSHISKYTYIPANEADDILYSDGINFETLTDGLTPTASETLIANIDDINYFYLDIDQAETTTTANIANIKVNLTLTRFNIQRSLSLIIFPRRLLWDI